MNRTRGGRAAPRLAALLAALSVLALCAAGPVGPLPNVTGSDLGLIEGGCARGDVVYLPGDELPGAGPCERCTCARGSVQCARTRCEPRAGCKALHRPDHCCPTYQCECEQEGRVYGNGEKLVDPQDPCRVCYCQGGEVVCRRIACFVRDDCRPRRVPGRCCPEYDDCPLRGVTTIPGVAPLAPEAAPAASPSPGASVKQEITIKEITPVSEIPVITELKIKEIPSSPSVDGAEYASSKSPLIVREATSDSSAPSDDNSAESSGAPVPTQSARAGDAKPTDDAPPSKISLSTQDSINSEIYPAATAVGAGATGPAPPASSARAPALEEDDTSLFEHNPAFPPIPDDLSVLSNHDDDNVPEHNADGEHGAPAASVPLPATTAAPAVTERLATTSWASAGTTSGTTVKMAQTDTAIAGASTAHGGPSAAHGAPDEASAPAGRQSPMLDLRSVIPTEILNVPSFVPEDITGDLDDVADFTSDFTLLTSTTTENVLKLEDEVTEHPKFDIKSDFSSTAAVTTSQRAATTTPGDATTSERVAITTQRVATTTQEFETVTEPAAATTTTRHTDATTERAATTSQHTNATTERAAATTRPTDVTTERAATNTQHTDATTERAVTTTQHTKATTERATTTTQHSDATTERAAATTQHTNATTEWAATTTQHSDATTERAAATTQHTNATTEWAATTTQQSDATTERAAATTQHTNATMERAAATTRPTDITTKWATATTQRIEITTERATSTTQGIPTPLQTTSSIDKSNIATEIIVQTELSSVPIENTHQTIHELPENISSDKITSSTVEPHAGTTLLVAPTETEELTVSEAVSAAAGGQQLESGEPTEFIVTAHGASESATGAVELIRVSAAPARRDGNVLADLIDLVGDMGSIGAHTAGGVADSEELIPVNAGYKSKNSNWNLNSITETPAKSRSQGPGSKQRVEIEDEEADELEDAPPPREHAEPTTHRALIDRVADDPGAPAPAHARPDVEIITKSYVPTLSRRPTKVLLASGESAAPEEPATGAPAAPAGGEGSERAAAR